eukprot:6285847-Amphidinium_carterae.1
MVGHSPRRACCFEWSLQLWGGWEPKLCKDTFERSKVFRARSAKLEAMKAETLGTESELQGSKSRMQCTEQ